MVVDYKLIYEQISTKKMCQLGYGRGALTHVRVIYTPLHPILYSKTGVYRGIHHLIIFAL